MIDFKSTLKMAVVSLKINKMRSILTSLGIIIGVSAVIIMLAVGSGASKKNRQRYGIYGQQPFNDKVSLRNLGRCQNGFRYKTFFNIERCGSY